MKISVLLPDWSRSPIGGFKVAYEYANFLARRGHQITVFHLRMRPVGGGVRRLLRYHLVSVWLRLRPRASMWWFTLDPRVRVGVLHHPVRMRLPDADVLLLTGWRTAAATATLSPRSGVRVQLVYDYEFWRLASRREREAMAAAFRAGSQLIATSCAVAEMLHELGAQEVALIECGLDTTVYRLTRPLEARSRMSVAFPLRTEAYKGTADALAAAELLRARFGPSLNVRAFGPASIRSTPSWLEVVRSPSDLRLAELYNSVSVFILPSHFEGWGLPAAEAMACGAAVVCADSGGVRDFARHNETALLVPPGDPAKIAAAVAHLIDDDGLRLRLARSGHAEVQRLTWERAGTRLEHLLTGLSQQAI